MAAIGILLRCEICRSVLAHRRDEEIIPAVFRQENQQWKWCHLFDIATFFPVASLGCSTMSDTVSLAPEWLRMADAVKFSGLSRSFLYENFDFAGGVIRTRNIRQRNKLRGIRLVNVDSLRAFIESEGREG